MTHTSVDDVRTGAKILDQGLFGAKIAVALLTIFGLLALVRRFGVGAGDPASVLSAAAVLLVVALFACYLPARSASRVDPMAALHEA